MNEQFNRLEFLKRLKEIQETYTPEPKPLEPLRYKKSMNKEYEILRWCKGIIDDMRMTDKLSSDLWNNENYSELEEMLNTNPDLIRDIKESFIREKIIHIPGYDTKVYNALCNTKLIKHNFEESVSWRTAGGIIAEIKGEGDYLSYYCSGEESFIDDEIRNDFSIVGWQIEQILQCP